MSADNESLHTFCRDSLNKAWTEIDEALTQESPVVWQFWQRDPQKRYKAQKHPNVTTASAFLGKAEGAAVRGQYGEVLALTAKGRDALRLAQMSETCICRFWAIFVLTVQVVYLVLGAASLFSYWQQCYPVIASSRSSVPSNATPMTTPITQTAAFSNTTLTALLPFGQPITTTAGGAMAGLVNLNVMQIQCGMSFSGNTSGFFVEALLWAFLGGVAWCMYGLMTWYSKRLFNMHYVFWYLLHPWLSAIVGGALTLALLGGLFAVQNQSTSIMSLASFVVGLSTFQFMKLLIKTIATLLGGDATNSETAI